MRATIFSSATAVVVLTDESPHASLHSPKLVVTPLRSGIGWPFGPFDPLPGGINALRFVEAFLGGNGIGFSNGRWIHSTDAELLARKFVLSVAPILGTRKAARA